MNEKNSKSDSNQRKTPSSIFEKSCKSTGGLRIPRLVFTYFPHLLNPSHPKYYPPKKGRGRVGRRRAARARRDAGVCASNRLTAVRAARARCVMTATTARASNRLTAVRCDVSGRRFVTVKITHYYQWFSFRVCRTWMSTMLPSRQDDHEKSPYQTFDE